MIAILMLLMPFFPFGSMPVSVFQFLGDSALEIGDPDTFGCEDASDESWTDPRLGTFSRDPKTRCAPPSLLHRSCCRPSQPDDIDVRFIVDNGNEVLVTRNYRSHRLLDAVSRGDRPVAWIVPGMLSDDFVVREAVSLSETFLRKGYTVMYLEWDEVDKKFGQSVADAPVVGAMLGSMILESETWERSLCVGFSFGAHICAMAGKYLKQEGQVLPRCHLLDPAGPGFEVSDESRRISPGDCDLMSAVYTTTPMLSNFPISKIHAPGFGTLRRGDANCNFIVNRGMADQHPGCFDLRKRHFLLRRVNWHSFRSRGPSAQRCSHARALSLFLSSLRDSCPRLVGQDMHHLNSSMSFPPFDECKKGMKKVLIVNTTMVSEPYC